MPNTEMTTELAAAYELVLADLKSRRNALIEKVNTTQDGKPEWLDDVMLRNFTDAIRGIAAEMPDTE
jgi:hypothetical protein